MFNVVLTNITKARIAISEASAILKKDSRIMQDVASSLGGNYALEKCRKSIEFLTDRVYECHKETDELSYCLQEIIDCYKETEEKILETGVQDSGSLSNIEFGICDYGDVADTMASMNIRFVTM